MRVLMLNNEYPPIGGGAATATQALLNEFAGNRDLAIHLITSSERAEGYGEQPAPNISIQRLPVGKEEPNHWSRTELLRYMRLSNAEIKKELDRNSYDLIHAFFTLPAGWTARSFCRKLPYIVSLRGSDVPGFNQRFRWEYRISRGIVRRIWREAGSVVANSSALKKLALETAPSQEIEVIPNGVQTDVFHPASTLRDPSLAPGLLYVGRLTARKQLDSAIRSIARLRDEGISLPFQIVGGGEEKPALMKLTRDLGVVGLIDFMGHVERERLPEVYRNADIFLLPSRWEGMSNALLEAMASGLAVIVSDTGGTRELVKGNGVIVPEISPDSLMDAIRKISKDRSQLESMKRRSHERAMDFTWAGAAGAYENTYRKIVVSAKKRSVA